MRKRNIILIGFMGSGKTQVSKSLGKILGIETISTDHLIEKREGRSISEIFAESGEEYFRSLERQIIIEVCQKEGVVIDCGGGVVMDPKNLIDLKESGITIYLSASAEFLYAQIQKSPNRPLLNVPDPLAKIKEMLKIRAPLYERADINIVSENNSIDQIVNKIIEELSYDE
jgi:shikimate kinase